MLQNEIMVKDSSVFDSGEKELNSIIVNPDKALKQELRIAAGHCQLLAEKLCRNDMVMPRKSGMLTPPESCSTPEGECCREQKLKNTAVVAENIKLRQVLKDVTEVNKNWQKYNAKQQEYINRLHTTIDTLGTGIEVPTVETSHVPFRQEEYRNRVSTAEASKTLLFLKKSHEAAENECRRLEKVVEELCAELKSKDQELQVARKIAEKSSHVELNLAQEQVEILKIQAKMHKEDWEVERTDNKRLKEKLVKAEANIRDLTLKCESLVSRLQRIQEVTLDFGGDSNSKVSSSIYCVEDVEKNHKENQKFSDEYQQGDLFPLHHGSLKDIQDSCKTYPWELVDPADERLFSDPTDTNYKRYQMTAHVLASRSQPRVLSRGPRRSWENFSKRVFGEVELDFANTQSLPIQRISSMSDPQIFDLSEKLNNFDMVTERAPDCGPDSETHQEQFLCNEQVLLSERFEKLHNDDRTKNDCLVSLE